MDKNTEKNSLKLFYNLAQQRRILFAFLILIIFYGSVYLMYNRLITYVEDADFLKQIVFLVLIVFHLIVPFFMRVGRNE